MPTATLSPSTLATPSSAADRLRQLGYDPDSLLAHFQSQGYVIVDGVLSSTSDSSLGLESLRSCAQEAIQLTRSGDWTARRVVGNAFPPFDRDNRDSWGVQHIMNPQLDAVAQRARLRGDDGHASTPSSSTPARSLSKTFQDFYSSSPLLDIASLLVGAPEERMQMELFNLLINPEAHSYFALSWHRDDIRPDVDEAEELQRLARPTYGVQFNTALYDDDCLFIVPGTHRRPRTAEERKANMAKAPPAIPIDGEGDDRRAELEKPDGGWEVDPPQTLRVRLKAGQTAFYSQRILHRASYLASRKRATLHACYGDIGDDEAGEAGGAERARNILQHGVEWMRDEEFGASLPPRLRPMWNNLIRTEKKWAEKDLGYSLDN
ncbi:uncharacterized protein PFL1_05566 [Pseudozyma flocculosa PF-1]|uniref:Phytanoyl-CoA dioxygenase n=2 Tax=Pseudozyma flocculosa TaxID=84751 RepID=A0A5C3FAA9_9BASI|nr:uncharacterized protein PFL1_05566 [Pseudozyma flocculosa PF-1]EPQ26932.1 hypothetical protein PFL1_05566 [Pseudozyma flocculosa PF-1]SPO41160.1 uncharacterized protein PSFLO_06642 [Pseudozyma flocculosa]